MIRNITVKNFKALRDLNLKLTNLNLFTGLNGMGKSSLIQTLLLLRQSYNQNYLHNTGLNLNGEYVSIGTAQDALTESTEEDYIRFIIDYGSVSLDWKFSYKIDSDILPIKEFSPSTDDLLSDSTIEKENITVFNNNFNYLSAERLAPQIIYPASNYETVEKRNLGNKGEYTANYLAKFGSEDIAFSNMKYPNTDVLTLDYQVSMWLGEISSSIRPRTSAMSLINSVILNYEFETKDGHTKPFRATNVGFGISYILPVLTGILSAKSDSLLIIENPESHIHPRGQTILGELLALAADNGVQLMIETHSDHILNGIRVAIKKYKLSPEKFGVFFFERNESVDGHESKVNTPSIDHNGRINSWPKNFFDEWEKNLIELL